MGTLTILPLLSLTNAVSLTPPFAVTFNRFSATDEVTGVEGVEVGVGVGVGVEAEADAEVEEEEVVEEEEGALTTGLSSFLILFFLLPSIGSMVRVKQYGSTGRRSTVGKTLRVAMSTRRPKTWKEQ